MEGIARGGSGGEALCALLVEFRVRLVYVSYIVSVFVCACVDTDGPLIFIFLGTPIVIGL